MLTINKNKVKGQFILLILLFIISCSEDDKSLSHTCKPTKLVGGLGTSNTYDLFEWDLDGRLTKKEHYQDDLLNYTAIFIYRDSITVTYNNSNLNRDRYFYNDKEQLVKEISITGSNKDTIYFTYSDNSKYFTGQYYKGAHAYGLIMTFEWSNGNIVKVSYKDDYESGYFIIEYDNKSNPFHGTIHDDLRWLYFAEPNTYSKNNPVKITWYPDGAPIATSIITYQYNESGYPTGYTNSSTNIVASIEYDCNI